MAIYTKNGKLLFVDGKAAVDEACCCNGGTLFHVSPNSLTPVPATTDFSNIFEPLADRYRQWLSLPTAIVAKYEGYVAISTDPGAATTTAVGICPNLENGGETWCGGSDDFYVRMDFAGLSLTDINFATYRFGIHFHPTTEPAMDTNYWIGREIDASLHKVSWRNFDDPSTPINRTTVGNITSGYFEVERISGTLTLKLNGITYSSISSSSSFGAPWFGFKSWFNPGTVGSANVTSAIVQKNNETAWVLQKRWVDLVTPFTNDAIAAGETLYRTKYVEDMKNSLDGVSMGGYNSIGNYRYMITALQLPAETLCFHVVTNLIGDHEYFGNQVTPYLAVESSGGELRIRDGTNTFRTAAAYSGWKVITFKFSATSPKIYVNGVEVTTYAVSMTPAEWTDIRLGDEQSQTDIAELEVTEDLTAAAIIAKHTEWMTDYNIT